MGGAGIDPPGGSGAGWGWMASDGLSPLTWKICRVTIVGSLE